MKSRINRGRTELARQIQLLRVEFERPRNPPAGWRGDGADRQSGVTRMNLHTEHAHDLAIVRVGETRLMYPLLSEFSSAVLGLIAGGREASSSSICRTSRTSTARRSAASWTCTGRRPPPGAALKLSGVQKRVETMLTMTGAQNFLELHADEASARQELRELAMRTIKTSTGAEVSLDGDLLPIMEVLYHEVTAQRALDRSFEDMVREIKHLIEQMTDDELRSYLAESLFLNTVKYENDRLEAYMEVGRARSKSSASPGSAVGQTA